MTREELLVERITYITKIALGEELNNMLGIEVDKDFNEAILQASIKAAKVGMKFADEHPHWISVEDELPPKESEYDDLSNNVLATDGKEIYESVYNYDFENWFTHDAWGLDNITHWMPLPTLSCSDFPNNQERRVIGTANHIKTALDVMKEGGEG